MINLKKNDAIADAVRGIMEKELKGNQVKLDKNHNGKLDAQDFKILRGQKKATEEVESVEENAFDYKSPRQPEPNGGSGVKKGTRYGGSKQKEKPEQEEPKEKKEETSYFKERLIERAMLKMAAKKAFKALTGGSDEDQRKDLQRKMGVPQTGQKPTQKEEFEQIDEALEEFPSSKHGNFSVNSKVWSTKEGFHKGQHVGMDTLIHKGTIQHKDNSKPSKFEVHNHVNRGLTFQTHHSDEEKHAIKQHLIKNKMASKHTDITEETELDEGSFNADAALRRAAADDKKKAQGYEKVGPYTFRKKKPEEKPVQKEEIEQMDEREMSGSEMKKREEIVKSMKKGMSGFKERYGKRAKDVMYATATKQAMK